MTTRLIFCWRIEKHGSECTWTISLLKQIFGKHFKIFDKFLSLTIFCMCMHIFMDICLIFCICIRCSVFMFQFLNRLSLEDSEFWNVQSCTASTCLRLSVEASKCQCQTTDSTRKFWRIDSCTVQFLCTFLVTCCIAEVAVVVSLITAFCLFLSLLMLFVLVYASYNYTQCDITLSFIMLITSALY